MNNKKIIRATNTRKQEADIARYMQEVRAMQAAGITRRDLFKMGLTTGVGGLVAIGGASFIPNLARANTAMMISPACEPWMSELPIPQICKPTDTMMGGADGQPRKSPSHSKEGLTGDNTTSSSEAFIPDISFAGFTDARKEDHQQWNRCVANNLNKAKLYELQVSEIDWNFYPDVDLDGHRLPTADCKSKVWTYSDLHSKAVGLLKIEAQYGTSTIMRMYNCLPPDADGNHGFGINIFNTHLHNGHTAPESDGGGFDDLDTLIDQYYDYHYANQRVGFTNSSSEYNGKSCWGDYRETLSSLWFHDHTEEFTAQNVVKGMVSFYSLFSNDINLDTGDETTGLRLPSGKYDIPLCITDRTLDANGEMFLDTFVNGGMLGDCQTVNLKIKPFLKVDRRKYRFRILSAGPARVLQLFVKYNGKVQQITRVGCDGNLLPKALLVNSMRMAPAERADIIVDFSQYPVGAEIYLENCLEQLKVEAPTTTILPSSINTQLLKFIVGDYVDDFSGGDFAGTPETVRSLQLKNLQTQTMLEIPALLTTPAKERRFSFGKGNGVWNVNGLIYDPDYTMADPEINTHERWIFEAGGGWIHPVHHHHTEGQIISRDGKMPQPDERGRKDAYRIGDAALETSGSSTMTVDIKFSDWLGRYPCHCHNNMHEDAGMMFKFEIKNDIHNSHLKDVDVPLNPANGA